MKKAKLTLLLATIIFSLCASQEIEYIGRTEMFAGLSSYLTQIRNSERNIREIYKLYLRAEAIVQKYPEYPLRGNTLVSATKEIDSVRALIPRIEGNNIPAVCTPHLTEAKTALHNYCDLAQKGFENSNKKEAKHYSILMKSELQSIINSINAIKEESQSRYVCSIRFADQYLLPPAKRNFVFGRIEEYRPELEKIDVKLEEIHRSHFVSKKRKHSGYALVVAIYEGLIQDIYTEHFTVEQSPTGDIKVALKLDSLGKVHSCTIMESTLTDTLFQKKLADLIEKKWHFGYGNATTAQIMLRVHAGMHRERPGYGKSEEAEVFGRGGPATGLNARLCGMPKKAPQVSRTRAEIMRVVRDNILSLKNIYNKYLETRPNLQGKVTVKMFVSSAGTLSGCILLSSTTGDSTFDADIVSEVKTWNFGKGTTTTVTYPFVFSK